MRDGNEAAAINLRKRIPLPPLPLALALFENEITIVPLFAIRVRRKDRGPGANPNARGVNAQAFSDHIALLKTVLVNNLIG